MRTENIHHQIIFHCAGYVNVVQPYSSCRAVNVEGTREVLRFVLHGKPKRLHYASTLSVFVSSDRNTGVLYESDNLNEVQQVFGGYAQSKWIAEQMIEHAIEKGLKGVSLYRLGLLTGDSETGLGSEDDFLSILIRGLTHIEAAPNLGEAQLFVDITPVDYAAQTMVALARKAAPARFHIANSKPASFVAIVQAIEEEGTALVSLDPEEWQERVFSTLAGDVPSAATLLGLCRALPSTMHFDAYRSVDLFQATGVRFDQSVVIAALQGDIPLCPEPTNELLRLYVREALRVLSHREGSVDIT